MARPPANIRQGLAAAAPDGEDRNITVIDADEAPDGPVTDDKGEIIRIEHGDGSVTVALGGASLGNTRSSKDGGWFRNLVEDIGEQERGAIADELLRGIDADLESRIDWIETRATGIKLLGLKIEVPNQSGAADGAPVEGMSRVRHPLLLEAVLRFQANARSELLPTDGPVKVRNDDTDATLVEDQTADALEMDLNHYLTTTASEYYPDTDRMLLKLGFGGTQFKKVYFCPLRNRPVSETVDADDLIVDNTATDLKNAKRITHKVMMRPSTVKRLQILGVYRDIDLSDPMPQNLDSQQRAEREQQGVSEGVMRPQDRDREMYECYSELNIKGFEHRYKGDETGLEIPYRVTIDLSSREILSIVRNYDEDTKEMPEARAVFVKYIFVPGLGFYDIGLLHILGNTTNAITAAWREMLDNGMFANFPGFLVAKQGARQNTNIFRVPPGGGAQVDTGGMPMNQAVMPLPYSTQGMPALMSLVGDMAQTGMRIGGTSEQQVGEGRADAPVGTTLAMIEQASKVMNSVHKRLHAAQCEEFKLLIQCFREHPESFVERNCKSKTKWDEETFLRAINNCDLVPQADPNTASHAQRVMKIMALKQLQAASPSLYDPIAIDTAALQAIGWSNPQQFMVPQSAQAEPPPELLEVQAKIANDGKKADADLIRAQADQAETQAKISQGAFAPKPPAQTDPADMQIKAMDAQTRAKDIQVKHQDAILSNQNQDADRQSREKIELLKFAAEIVRDHAQSTNGADHGKQNKSEH